jgi:hypothetical protein
LTAKTVLMSRFGFRGELGSILSAKYIHSTPPFFKRSPETCATSLAWSTGGNPMS